MPRTPRQQVSIQEEEPFLAGSMLGAVWLSGSMLLSLSRNTAPGSTEKQRSLQRTSSGEEVNSTARASQGVGIQASQGVGIQALATTIRSLCDLSSQSGLYSLCMLIYSLCMLSCSLCMLILICSLCMLIYDHPRLIVRCRQLGLATCPQTLLDPRAGMSAAGWCTYVQVTQASSTKLGMKPDNAINTCPVAQRFSQRNGARAKAGSDHGVEERALCDNTKLSRHARQWQLKWRAPCMLRYGMPSQRSSVAQPGCMVRRVKRNTETLTRTRQSGRRSPIVATLQMSN